MTKNQILGLWIMILILALATGAEAQTAEKRKQRVGCVCKDGERRSTTGAGSCSGHGGVKYWLYADVEVYQQYSDNLPAIPDTDLIWISPDDVDKTIKVIENLPAIRDDIQEDLESDRSRNQRRDRDYDYGSDRWNVQDFFMPFLIILVAVLLFSIVIYIVKKLI
ncbi:MAG: hypothetical protein JJT94_16680 [Bernardetiaceae bacterium]|nr:hypothetical protein [Bernardetiaceae bacterium]